MHCSQQNQKNTYVSVQKVERCLSCFCLFVHQLTSQLTMTITYSLVNSVIHEVLQLKNTTDAFHFNTIFVQEDTEVTPKPAHVT